jgi:hypothetical protein
MAKPTKVTGWRSRSNRYLGGVAAVALIVTLLGGMGLGYAIEKSRVKSSPKTSAAQRAKLKARARKAAAAKNSVGKATILLGTVTGATRGTITVTPKKGAKRTIVVGSTTAVFRADAGTAGDIATGAKVVMVAVTGAPTKARLVIVQPANAPSGKMVTAADASTMSLNAGKSVIKITTTGSTVETVTPAKLSNLTKGTRVLVAVVRTKAGVYIAREVILVPSTGVFQ